MSRHRHWSAFKTSFSETKMPARNGIEPPYLTRQESKKSALSLCIAKRSIFRSSFSLRGRACRLAQMRVRTSNYQAPSADDLNGLAIRLEVFSKNVSKLGRKMRWPWLEPRIKRCQEHLGRLKVSLMLSLQPLGGQHRRSGRRGSVETIAEALRQKMTKIRAKETQHKPSSTQSPNSRDEVNEEADARSRISDASIASGATTSSSSEIINDGSVVRTPFLAPGEPPRPHRSRTIRAVRALRTVKVYIRRRAERRTMFKKDSASTVFEAYLIYPILDNSPGPLFGETASTPLPFGHRRLTHEVKRALKKGNPWDILLVLSPSHRALVDRVVEQAQISASTNMSVCLVAIDVDGYSDVVHPGIEAGPLVWRKMVLFFRYEAARPEDKMAENKRDVIGGLPRFPATVRNLLRSSQWRNTKHKELQAKLKQEKDDKEMKEARNQADRESVEKNRADIEEAKETLEAEKTRLEEERRRLDDERARIAEEYLDAVESKNQALTNAEEAVLKGMERGIANEELKKIFEEERAKKMTNEEITQKKTLEEKATADKAKPPIKLKDALGRKFNFPFHLVQTWQGMEDLIKSAFEHVEVTGPHVQEGHYDLIDSEGHIILSATWAESIRPGEQVSMRMWPMDKLPLPPPLPPGMTREQHIAFLMEQNRRRHAALAQGRGHHHGGGHAASMRPPAGYTGPPMGGQPPPPPGMMRPPPPPGMMRYPPPGGQGMRPTMVDIVEGGRPKKNKGMKAKKTMAFFSGARAKPKIEGQQCGCPRIL